MKQQEEYSIFSSIKGFSPGGTTQLAYLCVEEGKLLDFDLLVKRGSQTFSGYTPVWVEVCFLQLKSRQEKTDLAQSKKGSSPPLTSWVV